jgi:sugar phosphate isomerase/epimerase
MQLGFVSAILPDQTLEQVLTLAAAHGYRCVELMCWPHGRAERRYAGVTHLDVDALDDAAVARIHEQLARHHVGISALGYYPNLLSPNADEARTGIAHLRQVMQAAKRLGIGQVNTFVGRDQHRSVDDNWPRFLEVWRPLVAEASALGLRLGIENCPMLFTADEWPGGKNLASTPAIWRRMFNDLPDPCFGLNYDPSHLVWQRIDHLPPLREFAARIHHVHAKDVRVDHARLAEVGILATPLSYHQPVLPGRGDIDWPRFFGELRAIGYGGPVCVEVEDRAFEADLAGRHEALRQAQAFLAPLMAQTEVPNAKQAATRS